MNLETEFQPANDSSNANPSESPAPLRLSLLGALTLRTATGEDVTPRARKARQLLAFLALSPGGAASRGKIAGLLWSEHGEDRARACLRQVLKGLRNTFRTADDEALFADRQVIGLRLTRIDVDVLQAEGAIGSRKHAMFWGPEGAWQQDFLAHLGGGDAEFDTWADTEQLRRESSVCGRLRALLDDHLERGQDQPALWTARDILRIRPFDESVHRVRLQLLAEHGDRASALCEYRRFRTQLLNELNVEPSSETEAVAAGLRLH